MPAMSLIPRKAQLCLRFLSVLLLSALCFAQPTLTLSVKSWPPTTNLNVSGSGFPAFALIDIHFDTTDLALVNANGSGGFSKIHILVPAAALPGKHWVSAEERSTETGAQMPFTVYTNWAQFHFAPNHSGLNPYENVLSATTAGNLGLRWSYTPGGAVESSPAVAQTARHGYTRRETVLHSFVNVPKGADPYAGVIRDSAGNLYSTTSCGAAVYSYTGKVV